MGIDPFQAAIARIALAASAQNGFALAGGNALVVHGLVQRPTQDIDLFTAERGGPGVVVARVREALEAAGCSVEIVRRPEDSDGEFVQLAVTRGEEAVLLDLARDWRQLHPIEAEIGPVLHLDDAIGSKMTAMIARSLPRDYIDIAAALRLYSRADLLRLALERDPGLRVTDVAAALRLLDGLPDPSLAAYGLDEAGVAGVRSALAPWPRDPAADTEGHAVHAATR